MPRRRFFRRRGKGYRKSYFIHLFEVDRMSCGILSLANCPIGIVQYMGDNICFVDIVQYLNTACRAYKQGNGAFNYNYIESVGAGLTTIADYMTDPARSMNLIVFLYRYFVPALFHYYAYVEGSTSLDETTGTLCNSITEIAERYNSTGEYDEEKTIELIASIFQQSEILISPNGNVTFYPPHKLIGHRVGNILRRCQVKFLIYPYPLEPFAMMVLKAQNYVTAYETGLITNVGPRGLKTLASKASDINIGIVDYVRGARSVAQNTGLRGVNQMKSGTVADNIKSQVEDVKAQKEEEKKGQIQGQVIFS